MKEAMEETESKLRCSKEELEALQGRQAEYVEQNKKLEEEVEMLKKDNKDMNVQLADDVNCSSCMFPLVNLEAAVQRKQRKGIATTHRISCGGRVCVYVEDVPYLLRDDSVKVGV